MPTYTYTAKDISGAPQSGSVSARDISELRHAEEEGGKNRAFLASLADLAPDEIYTLDT